jgi:hypothetical protein
MPKNAHESYEAKLAAELRQLTVEARRLRDELRGMVGRKTTPDPLRAIARGEPLPGDRRQRDVTVKRERRSGTRKRGSRG